MQAAEKLHKFLWGKGLKSYTGVDNLKYVPTKYIDLLELEMLRYVEGIRAEYDAALKMLGEDEKMAMDRKCGGVVVTGIGVFSLLTIESKCQTREILFSLLPAV